MKRLTLILALVLVSVPCVLAEEGKMALEVSAQVQSDDSVGSRLVYALKEEIRKSGGYRLTYQDEPRIKLIVLTMPRFTEDASIATMYSVIWTYEDEKTHPIYWDATIGYAGAQKVDESARTIMAATDDLIERARKRR